MMRDAGAADRFAIALDTDDLDQAISWAKAVQGVFGIAKVGLQLFSAHGPGVVHRLQDLGFQIFLDLKLHDIPATVEKSAQVIGKLGVSFTTVHAAGGVDMVRAALSGLREGSSACGAASVKLLGVTVLTSVQGVSNDDLEKRISILVEAGASGLVCAPTDLAFVNSLVPEFLKVVPGIRRKQDALDDQARVAGPDEAVAAGADVLVIGRPVTSSVNPRSVAEDMCFLVEFASKLHS